MKRSHGVFASIGPGGPAPGTTRNDGQRFEDSCDYGTPGTPGSGPAVEINWKGDRDPAFVAHGQAALKQRIAESSAKPNGQEANFPDLATLVDDAVSNLRPAS